MNTKLIRQLIRSIILEAEKKTLGEPDTTAEKHRDEPQPQYEEEEEGKDADEASVAGGVAGFMAPLGHGNGPGDKPYKKNKK